MAPEYGATCGFFPIDDETLRYLRNTGRDKARIALVEAYAKENGFWRGADYAPIYTDTLHLDMGTIVPAISGPKRPQDYVALTDGQSAFRNEMAQTFKRPMGKQIAVAGEDYTMESGKVVIASITSCTNTSNPYVMIGAGLVARKAAALGMKRRPWVKTSLAPGSQVVSAYLEAADLQADLDNISFNLVGYGCTTCIGNSGPIQAELSAAIAEGDLVATAVLSGNRNFEGRISPDVRANYLASPPLVVAYALAGTMDIDLSKGPVGQDKDGNDVFLKDIWPTSQEVAELVEQTVTRQAFLTKYADVFKGDEKWQGVETTEQQTYDWPPTSTYVQNPPYFQGISKEAGVISNISDAKVLAVLGDMITTDHISPAGSFKDTTPAGQYLLDRQVPSRDFNSYGSRRGNHEIMMRGTFANIRIKNEILNGVEGGYTKGPDGTQTSIYEAAMMH
jgi:aconitate hydratase